MEMNGHKALNCHKFILAAYCFYGFRFVLVLILVWLRWIMSVTNPKDDIDTLLII